MKQFQYTITDPVASTPAPPPAGEGGQSLPELYHRGEGRQDRRRHQAHGPDGMGIKQGNTVTVTVEGADEEEAAAAMEKFFQENL